jgi:hypothetical protein
LEPDDFGRPLVRHRHPVGTILAYVSKDAEGVTWAACPSCSRRVQLDTLDDGSNPERAVGHGSGGALDSKPSPTYCHGLVVRVRSP